MRLFLTILLNAVIGVLVLIFIFVGYMVFSAYSKDEAHISDFINPSYLISLINFDQSDQWLVHDSITYTFEHPASWKPIRKQNAKAGSIELIDLRIPVVFSLPRMGSTTTIGYYRETVSQLRPSNLIDETPIELAGRQGYRWIYKTESKYVVYEYAIPLSTELSNSRQASTLAIQVESVREDKDLEEILDRVARSVKFKDI